MKIHRVEDPGGNFIEGVVPDLIAKSGEDLLRSCGTDGHYWRNEFVHRGSRDRICC